MSEDNSKYVGKSVKTKTQESRTLGGTEIDEVTTWKRFYPTHTIGMVNVSYGTPVSERSTGVWVTVTKRVTRALPLPHWCAEVYSDDCDNESGHYAEIGLTFQGRRLEDYEGVAELPSELKEVLREIGMTVPWDY